MKFANVKRLCYHLNRFNTWQLCIKYYQIVKVKTFLPNEIVIHKDNIISQRGLKPDVSMRTLKNQPE